jgi:hypothetical protein
MWQNVKDTRTLVYNGIARPVPFWVIVPVQITDSIFPEIMLGDPAFPDLFSCKFILFENGSHISDVLGKFVLWILLHVIVKSNRQENFG